MAKVSVIIPVYNSEQYLRDCLDSVLKQTFTDFEVICVDDGSTDKSNIILDEYAHKDNRITIFKQENKGPSEARNFGWNKAQSQFIAFLDSDDVWHGKKLELQYDYMSSHKNIFFTCHQKKVLNKQKLLDFYNTCPKIKQIIKMKAERLLFRHYSNGATSSFMIRNVGNIRFDISKRRSEDYLLSLLFLFNYEGACIDGELSASFKETYGAQGLSKDLWKMEKGDLDTFNSLRKKGYISRLVYMVVCLFSLLKYIRRYIVCTMRR